MYQIKMKDCVSIFQIEAYLKLENGGKVGDLLLALPDL